VIKKLLALVRYTEIEILFCREREINYICKTAHLRIIMHRGDVRHTPCVGHLQDSCSEHDKALCCMSSGPVKMPGVYHHQIVT
jgi:hypothetical protein